MKIILVGSGFSIKQTKKWDLSTHIVVVINNAWRAVKWDHFLCTHDYETEYHKDVGFPSVTEADRGTKFWDQKTLNDAVLHHGSWNDLGRAATIAAGYCALRYYKDADLTQIGLIGCDMIYTDPEESDNTAYYGVGVDIDKKKMSDPDRMIYTAKKDNHTVGGKLAKSYDDTALLQQYYKRLAEISEEKYGVNIVNYSTSELTRLPYPRAIYE